MKTKLWFLTLVRISFKKHLILWVKGEREYELEGIWTWIYSSATFIPIYNGGEGGNLYWAELAEEGNINNWKPYIPVEGNDYA